LEALQQQEQELKQTLNKLPGDGSRIDTAARAVLLTSGSATMAPMLQHRASMQVGSNVQARMVYRQKNFNPRKLSAQKQRQPQLQQAVMDVGTQIEQLKRVYLQQVQKKRAGTASHGTSPRNTNATMRNSWEN